MMANEAPRPLLQAMFDAAIAGALIAPDTLAGARAQGIRPRDSLDANEGHGFFEALGDSLVTAPTLTDVNDFRAILITGDAATPTLEG